MVPTENAIPLGAIDQADAGRWCAAGIALVRYGGLLAMGLQAAETLLVSGATGNYGSAAMATSLAMDAGCVVAPSRNEQVLADVVRRFGSRVRPTRSLRDYGLCRSHAGGSSQASTGAATKPCETGGAARRGPNAVPGTR